MKKKRKSSDASTPGISPKQSADALPSVQMDIDAFLDGGFEALSDTLPVGSTQGATDTYAPSVVPGARDGTGMKRNNKKKKSKSRKEGAGKQSAQGEGDVPQQKSGDVVPVSGPAAVQQELKSHKEELEALKLADPSFYEYLQQSDKSLLEFDSDGEGDEDFSLASEEDVPDDQDDEVDEPKAQPRKEKGTKSGAQTDTQQESVKEVKMSGVHLWRQKVLRAYTDVAVTGYVDTEAMRRWCSGAKKDASLGAVRRVIQLFRTACHYGDPAKDDDDSAMRIASDSAFQHILVFTLTEADTFFRKLLSLEEGCAHLPAATFTTAKWRKVGPLIKSYLGNTLHLLTHLAEEESSAFILRRLRASTPFLQPFDALQRKLLKLVAGLFGSSSTRRVRVQALLWLRDFGLTGGPKALPAVLTSSYRAYVANARIVTPASVPDLAFMVSGIVELYGLNLEASYEAMFGFVSQLAGILRSAMTAKTAEAYKQAYNWRTVNCLELWGRVVAAHATQGDLQPLVYPVVQLLLAAARLVASPRWFPIRLRLARILTAVAAATCQFVPVVPLLLEVLMWPGFAKPVSGVGRSPSLSLQLRLSKANLSSPSVQKALVEQTIEILAGALALYARSPALPELSHLPMLSLRRFIKSSPVDKFRAQATLLLHAVEAQAKLVGMERDGVDFAPKDLAAVSSFLSDKGDDSMPLIKFARKLAETATENRNTAEVESQQKTVEEPEEQEEGEAPDLLVPAVAHDDVAQGEVTESGKPMDATEEDVVEDFVLSDIDSLESDDEADMQAQQAVHSKGMKRAAPHGGREPIPSIHSGAKKQKGAKLTVKSSTNMRKSQGKTRRKK